MSAVTGGGAGLVCAEAARRAGIRPSMAAIMERALDLAGHAAAGDFGAEVGDFPEAGEYAVAGLVEPVLVSDGVGDLIFGQGWLRWWVVEGCAQGKISPLHR